MYPGCKFSILGVMKYLNKVMDKVFDTLLDVLREFITNGRRSYSNHFMLIKYNCSNWIFVWESWCMPEWWYALLAWGQ